MAREEIFQIDSFIVETRLFRMSLLFRIPALLVALGLLASGGQAKMCDFAALVGIDFHAPAEVCPHSAATHSHSESEPCPDDCVVELEEVIAPASGFVPSLLATEGLDGFYSSNTVFLSDAGRFDPVADIWHGPPLESPPSVHCDPLFSGRFQV
ncbi:hypothetical protein N9B73_01495 [Verrucomicrobiales bacterium]|nr:hypothetical protein [Verrucomicrobiales bacterium]|tara:strand:- start:679 stop:1140 length:462 start_codon:yes stop_codon:yes gene_type:complete